MSSFGALMDRVAFAMIELNCRSTSAIELSSEKKSINKYLDRGLAFGIFSRTVKKITLCRKASKRFYFSISSTPRLLIVDSFIFTSLL